MQTEPMVDIHCHLLPGVDDGAGDWEESVAMARMAAHDGTKTIIATPHQLGGHRHTHGDVIRAKSAELQQVLKRHGVELTVLPGADVRIETGMVALVQSDELLTLADRGRHLLLELPHELYIPLDRLLDELAAAGLVGILSHPERNQGILYDPSVLESIVDAGCLLQLTADSLTGAFGVQIQKLADSIIRQGMAHFVASDAHGTKLRRPLLQKSFQRVVHMTDLNTGYDLFGRNPTLVVQGQDVQPGRRDVQHRREFFGWKKAG